MNLTAVSRINIDTYVTAGTLQNLIGTAAGSNLAQSDLEAGVYFIAAQAAAPNPSLYPLWYKSDPADQVLKVFATPFDIWLTLGPDRFEIPFRNMSGDTAPLGALVCSTGASSFFTATNPSLNAIGFLQDTAASGAWAPIAIYGIGYALFAASSVSHPAGAQVEAGQALKAYGCPAGGIAGINTAAASGDSGPYFGMWLDKAFNPVPANSAHRAFIWGPKLTS